MTNKPISEKPQKKSIFRDFFSTLFEPLIKHPLLTVSASVIIGIAFFICVDIGLAELVRQNSHPIQLLATEQLIELGPNYTGESRRYAAIIDQYYIRHLEKRYYAAALRVLYPTLSPQKALASTREALEKATKEEAKESIWQAGITSNRLYKLCKRFPRSPIAWFKSEDLPDWLETALEEAFEEFHEQVNKLENAQTLDAAENECKTACRYSRETLILLSLARLGYDNKEKIESFLSDVERATYLAQNFAKRAELEKDEKKQVFEGRAKNMNLRAKVAEAILANDMDRTSELLSEVIEKALEKEKGKAAE